MKKTKYCNICKKLFYKKVNESKKVWILKRFCSLSCAGKDPKRIEAVRVARLNAFATGKIKIWNKDKKGLQVAWNKGNGEYAKKLGFGKWMIGRKGKLNGNWKGDKVGYGALHDWVRRELGCSLQCSKCPRKGGKPQMFHWANISNEYKRDLDDWIRLCAKCHKELDKNRKQTKYLRNSRY